MKIHYTGKVTANNIRRKYSSNIQYGFLPSPPPQEEIKSTIEFRLDRQEDFPTIHSLEVSGAYKLGSLVNAVIEIQESTENGQ